MTNETNAKLFALPQPILPRSDTNVPFLGRMVIEVWSKSERYCRGISTHHTNRILAGLRLPGRVAEVDPISLTTLHNPWMAEGVPQGEIFLGNAIFDVWEDQIVMGFTGARAELVSRAIKVMREPFDQFYLEPMRQEGS
jgi:hypothetical protein